MAYLNVIVLGSILVLALCATSPSSVSDVEMTAFMTSLWQADVNRASDSDITLALQARTSDRSHTDVAPNRLFAHVNQAIFTKETYRTLIALFDNYHRNIGTRENFTPNQLSEIDSFLNSVTNTSVMRMTFSFLQAKGFIGQNVSDLRQKLQDIWFTTYSRSFRSSHHQIDSSGFEHTFAGETYSNHVTGFHNWVRFFLEERNGNINYFGYIRHEEPRTLATHFSWHGLMKNLSSMWIGTSPEFEMAAYTSCYLIRRGRACEFSINGYPVSIQTYEFRGLSGQQVASAYVRV